MLGFASKAMKFGGDAFHASGLATYWNITSATDVAQTAGEAYQTYLHDSWNNNPNTFANLGVGIAQTAGSTIMAGSMWSMTGIDALNRYRGKNLWEATKFNNGRVITAAELGGMESSAVAALGKGRQGWLTKAGGFKGKIRGGGLKAGILGGVASIGVGILGSYALGMAGSLLDTAHQFDLSRKRMHYDSRYFNTGYQEQSAYQTIGSAMQDYETKMVSSARVLHSRG